MVPPPKVPPIPFVLDWFNLPEKDAPSIRIQERDIPQSFIAHFSTPSGDVRWHVMLKIFLQPDGSPRAQEVRIYSDDVRHVKSPFIQRWQIELVENEFHRLLTMAVTEISIWMSHGKAGEESKWAFGKHKPVTKDFKKEVERLTHRRANDPELFKRVARIYNEELKRASRAGKRPRMIKEIMDQMNTSRGTAESWVRTAKAIPGLIKPATPKERSVPNETLGKAAVSKSNSTTTKSKKGKP